MRNIRSNRCRMSNAPNPECSGMVARACGEGVTGMANEGQTGANT